MPLSEKKGRFIVSITEQPAKPSPPSSPPSAADPQASSPSNGSARAVKRGRFLVSCLPCTRPCLAPTLSYEQEHEEVGLLGGAGGCNRSSSDSGAAAAPAASRSSTTCSSSDGTHVTAMEHAAAVGEVSSPCPNSNVAGGRAPCCPPPTTDSPERRRVRFSDAADNAPSPAVVGTSSPQPQPDQQQQQQQQQLTHAKRSQLEDPQQHRQLKHTRSYCKGRFTIQEAVAVQCGLLHRSTSAPEWAMHRSASSCSLVPFMMADGGSNGSDSGSGCDSAFAAACMPAGDGALMCAGGSSGAASDNVSISSSCMEQQHAFSTHGCCAGLHASNQLMSGMTHMQHVQHQQHLAAAGDASSSSMDYALPALVGAGGGQGGLFLSSSVPVTGSALCCLDDGHSHPNNNNSSAALYASMTALSDCSMGEAGAFVLGPAAEGSADGNGSSSGRHDNDEGNGSRRGGGSGGSSALLRTSSSSNNMLSSSCGAGGSCDLLVAAAAAVGHHHHHHHQHGPKRSPSVSFFRRGRFLVQTTMG